VASAEAIRNGDFDGIRQRAEQAASLKSHG
jgi:hypothetical protein